MVVKWPPAIINHKNERIMNDTFKFNIKNNKTMKTRLFSDGNVGIKLNSVSEIMNFHALGDKFLICDDCEDYFGEYVTDTDEDGIEFEREPTSEEMLKRILTAFNNGCELYATFHLDCGKVVDDRRTTMQTDFYVGQEVYVMYNNKVTKTDIKQLILTVGSNCRITAKAIACDISKAFYDRCTTIAANGPTLNYITELIDGEQVPGHSSACVKIDGRYRYVELSEVFTTKEELAEHLIACAK